MLVVTRSALLLCCLAALSAASWENTVTSGGIGRAVFVPDTSRPVKAVLITNYNDPELQGRPDVLYANPDLRALGAKWNMMQMHWIGRPESDSAITAEYNAIVDTLNQVSTSLGKPEIGYTGIFIQGLSGTGTIAGWIAAKAPGRFGGVIKHHYSGYGVTSGMPCLYVAGGHDLADVGGFVHQTLQQQWDSVTPRAMAGEPATLYLEPGQYHDTAASDQRFTAQWLEDILTTRFPATIPTTSMINLPSWKDHRDWVGSCDVTTDPSEPWGRGARAINNAISPFPSTTGRPWIWLPSQRTAQSWKGLMDTGYFQGATTTPTTTVSLSSPQAGTVFTTGNAITATAAAAVTSGGLVRLEFYDNGALVGSDTSSAGGWSANWTISGAGTHSLAAKAVNSNGEQVTSAAVAVQVQQAQQQLRPADVIGANTSGVDYAYYEFAGDGSLPAFANLTPTRSGTAAGFDITAGGPRADSFAYRFTGYLKVPADGTYTLYTSSDDGSQLFIGSTLVVDNNGPHGVVERQGTIGLAAGTHAITVGFAQAAGGKSLAVQWQGPNLGKQPIPGSALVRLTTTGSALPSPWQGIDIGNVGATGTATYANGTFQVQGAGGDIWGTTDHFRFVYRTLAGDGQIVARVASLQNAAAYGKAGVMIRDGLASGSAHVLMDVTPGQGAEFVRRLVSGGDTTPTTLAGPVAPEWVRLSRSGATFTGAVSKDGTSWTTVGAVNISMGATVSVGLAVCSHVTGALATAGFDGVSVGGTLAGAAVPPPAQGAVSVNFQPATAPAVSGYLVDSGETFASRNGQSYGWNAPTSDSRDRELVADQLRDTFIHTQRAENPQATWEIAVANGQYQVHVVAGDPGYNDSVYQFDVEGVRVVSGIPTTTSHWVEGTVTVSVSDGRLTLSNGSGAVNNKVCFIELVPVPVGGG